MTGGYRKIKLFSLMVALIVAGLAVVGGTWATQVNYAKKETAKPHALKVEYQYLSENNEWTTMNAATKNVFDGRTWCPGRTEIIYLKVHNNESVPVDVNLNLYMEANEFAETETMTMAWLTNASLEELEKEIDKCSNWDDFYKTAVTQSQSKVNGNENTEIIAQVEVLDAKATKEESVLSGRNRNLVSAGQSYYIALAIHMDESTTSTYAGKTMSVKFKWQANSNEFSTAQSE